MKCLFPCLDLTVVQWFVQTEHWISNFVIVHNSILRAILLSYILADDHDDDDHDTNDHDDVLLSPEVPSVPVPPHRPGVRPGKDELITGAAPWLHLLRIVSLTVHLILVNAVGQVHCNKTVLIQLEAYGTDLTEQLLTGGAREAGGVKHNEWPELRSHHRHAPSCY